MPWFPFVFSLSFPLGQCARTRTGGTEYVEKECGPGTFFHPKLKVCDFEGNVALVKPECKRMLFISIFLLFFIFTYLGFLLFSFFRNSFWVGICVCVLSLFCFSSSSFRICFKLYFVRLSYSSSFYPLLIFSPFLVFFFFFLPVMNYYGVCSRSFKVRG